MSENRGKKLDQIGYEQLRLYWPYRAQRLEGVQITRQVNEHAKLYVSGIIPEEDGPNILQVQAEGEPIVLRQVDENGRSVRRLFHGGMISLSVHLSGGVYRFELEALSNSYQMDIRMEERAFQNRGWTFKELIQFIMKSYRYSDVIDQVTENTQLSGLVLQYKESDWMFLRRLASRFGTVLVPEITAASPKLFIGLPSGKVWRWSEDQPYQVRKELAGMDWHSSGTEERYIVQGSRGTQGLLQYTLASPETYALGDRVELPNGKELTVVYAHSQLESGLLMTTYRLIPEEHIRVPRCNLSDLIGLSLYGEVTWVIGDHVQIQLPIDEGPMAQGAACPYPVAPAYAAEGHSGLYIMPEIGDTVELYFPSSLESGAYIRHSISEGKRSANGGTDHKVWGHPAGSSIGMSPEEVTLQARSGLSITLNDQGVVLNSPGNLSIQGSNILLAAGKIEATAPEAIWLLGGGGSFILDGEANVRAGLLQQEGSNKAPVHVADLPPEPEPPLMPIEQYEAAQAAAADAAVTQASMTSPKDVSLVGAALALTAMIPVMGALGGGVAQAAVGMGIAAVATGLIGSVPQIGSFKPSALNLLGRFVNGFVEQQQQENDAKWKLFGKMLTAAKELTTATSPLDLLEKFHQQSTEYSKAYYEVPSSIREKWAKEYEYQQTDQELKNSLEFFNKVMNDKDQREVVFVNPYFHYIKADIGRPHLTVDQLGSYEYWESQALSLEEKKYLALRLKRTTISNEELAELIDGYNQHDAAQKGMDTQFGMNRRGGSAGGSAGLRPALPQASGTTPKGNTSQTPSFVMPKVKSFMIKSWEDSQKMGIVSGGGSHWSSNKKNKTGETASGNGKKASGGAEASSKPAEKPLESKPGSGSASPSKPNAGNAATTSKNSTTSKTNSGQSKPAKTGETPSENGKKASGGTGASSKPAEKPLESKPGSGSASSSKPNAGNAATTSKNNTTSKTKPEKNETPNEVNTWKPSTKKKDKGEPQGDTKAPKSPETNKPEENPNKPKDNSKGTEGKGKGKKLELSDFTKEIMETKPMNSPVPQKWYNKGGYISIDKNGTWTYTNKKGQSVSYPDGYPDFSEYYHPTVKPQTIEVTTPKNPQEDFKKANLEAGLNKDSDPPVPAINKPPEGYTWHHHEDGRTMVLVDEDIHREFRHIGGQSTVNGKNRKEE